ncbi:MAG: beta-ketoacyl-ACP synthase II [Ktedonobacteraceae bacterium]
MRQAIHRRVVVTGLGVVAANGIGKEAFWHATSNGISGIRQIQRFSTTDLPIHVAGEVSDFVVHDYIDRKLANRTDRMTHLVLPAVKEALQDAHLVIAEEDSRRIGAVIANTLGGVHFGAKELETLHMRGSRFMSAYTAIAWLQVANVGQTAIQFGVHGYSKTPVNDTIGGLDALCMAYGAIQRGEAEVIITGGCEAMLHPLILFVLGYSDDFVTGDDPTAYRPFDRRAAGLLIAEGAGICILEEYEHARQRGATIYGEIVGYGQTNDAHGLLPPSSNGTQYARAIRHAMQTSGLRTEDIAYFSLDGRAVSYSDAGEVEALHMTFGSDLAQLPVSVPRTMLGHSYAAAGALDAVTAFLALQHRLIPPTINCEELNPRYGLNMVRDEARPMSQQAVLLGGRAIGGANSVVALKQVS